MRGAHAPSDLFWMLGGVFMKTIISDSHGVAENAAQIIKALLDEKPDAALAFSAGRSMSGLFALLRDMGARGELSLDDARVFAVTQLIGTPEALSGRGQLERELLNPLGVKKENRFFPTAENFDKYDDLIAAVGGLDLAVIGLGQNGHIGYNEPGTPYASLTRIQLLAPQTRRALADTFGGEEKTPEKAATMGIKTLVSARNVAVVALGQAKAEAVFQMLYARDDSVVPAAFMQLPLNVSVLVDEEASAKL